MRLYTLRTNDHRVFFDVVYEWEDVFASRGMLDVTPVHRLSYLFNKVYGKLFPEYRLPAQRPGKKLGLYFSMVVTELKYVRNRNVVPIFLDLWEERDLVFCAEKMKKMRLFFVTSLDVRDRLLKINAGLNVRYMPLSISDIWRLPDVPEKTVDVVQMGRKNSVLHAFMLRYVQEHPGIEYVYSSRGGPSGGLKYISTVRGEIGAVPTREQFMALLRSARVSLVSSPARDSSRVNISDIDFPTPRFYESAICYCHMVGRYTDNKEFRNLRIGEICPNVETYETFATLMDAHLVTSNSSLREKFDAFIDRNVTSARTEAALTEIRRIVQRSEPLGV